VLRWLLRLDPRARRRAAEAGRALDERRWERDVERWEHTERDLWTRRNLALQDEVLEGLDDRALADHLRRAARGFAEGLTLHFALLGPVLAVGELLADGTEWGLTPAETSRLLKGASPASAAPVVLLRRVADALAAVGAEPDDLDGVRAASPEAAAALDEYLARHGWRLLTHDDVAGRTVVEMPGLVLQCIRSAARERGEPTGVDELVDELALRVPEGERARFRRTVAGARQGYGTIDDQSGVLGSWTGGLLRRALLATGERLQGAGSLAHPDHVFHLSADEAAALLEGGHCQSGTGSSSPGPSREDVSARADEWHQAAQASPPRHLGAPPAPPPDPSLFPPPMARMARLVGAYLALKVDRAGSDARLLAGTGIGTGVYRGRARVALDPIAALESLEPGDVLVAVVTTPAYNAALPVVGALVTEQGGLLSHPAVVARELGIPTVVGVVGATRLIPDGATVEVDAGTGQVRVVTGSAAIAGGPAEVAG